MRKIIISGGPCSGKTAVIEELNNRGYHVLSETALLLIYKSDKEKSKLYPWTNFEKFNKKMIQLQIQREKKLRGNMVFLDRSLIDALAYSKIKRKKLPKNFEDKILQSKYDKAFILEMLPKKHWNQTKNGLPRMQKYSSAVRIHKMIKKVYKDSEISAVKVPFMSIKKRVSFILRQI